MKKKSRFLSSELVLGSIKESFLMLSPRVQFRNPVMFVTYVGAILTTLYVIFGSNLKENFPFNLQISLWLWFTVLFANFAQSIAESRGKAQAASLRKAQIDSFVRLVKNNHEEKIPSNDLRKGDIIICEAGDFIPADGEVVEGIALIDESAITGESAPVIRESGGDRSAVTAGTKIVCDKIKILITSEKGQSFLDRMIHLIEGAKRQKTPNEVALNIVLFGLTIIFIFTVIALKFYADYSGQAAHQNLDSLVTVPVLVALLVCLIPTTISALLSAVGIAGMDRLIQRNVVAKSGRSVEAAGDIDLLILDKTGTITIGNRMATDFFPIKGVSLETLAETAQLASLSDETPEGRSIVVLAKKNFGLRAESLDVTHTKFIPFSAKARMSGVDFLDDKGTVVRSIRKGARDAIEDFIEQNNGTFPQELNKVINDISNQGRTPFVVSDNEKVLGVVQLKDIVKGGIKERFALMRKMGIKTVMITGDNPLTAAAIAAEAGVDDYVAEATPEIKLALIQLEQKGGRLVAMTGDGTNDAPALAQADVGVAMNTGTQASRDAGNMVDLDSNPTKLLDIVEIGKQLLMTRGALTTFSIANDVAKYFAIIPALFGALYMGKEESVGPLMKLNVMGLHSSHSAILSAVIFNALIIVALIPLALKGVAYKAESAQDLLRRNILIYGLGGIICPFIGIKIIDLLLVALGDITL